MRLNIHAGHNPDGKIACGAVGILKESTEARKVKDEVIRLLKKDGHVIYDCTINNGISQGDVLSKIVAKSNSHDVDLDISIHFNAGAKDMKGNGKVTGSEILLYSESSKAKKYAQDILKEMENLGFQNRGIKYRKDLYILNKTKAPAMLIECCFADDKDDAALYNTKSTAQAIVDGLNGKKPVTSGLYKVQCGAFREKQAADHYAERLRQAGFDAVIVK